MEICKSCDHNVTIECSGGCFFPHNTPPCFRQAIESQTTIIQQLKAEIAALIPALLPLATVDNRRLGIDQVIRKMRQLSAV